MQLHRRNAVFILSILSILKKVIVSVINDLATDQRVNKVCTSLNAMGFEILLVGRKLNNSLPLDARAYKMHRMKLLFAKGPLFYAEFNVRLFVFLAIHRAHILVSNDLDTLLPNFLISRIKRIPMVYDSHELFTETPEVINRPLIKRIWETIERSILPKLRDVITVNRSIADIFEAKYPIRVKVIRNVPKLIALQPFKTRQELGLPEKTPILILQGAGINVQRGAEELVEAMRYIDNALLLIIGSGDVLDSLKTLAARLGLNHKIMFIGKVPYSELMHYTANANLGLSLDKDTNPNYRYSLPNKLFDYIHAQIPVLASPMVEIKRIIDQYGVGETIENHNPEHIAAKINGLIHDEGKTVTYKANCIKAAQELCWEHEELTLNEIYGKFIK